MVREIAVGRSLTVPGITTRPSGFSLSAKWGELSRNRLVRVVSRRLVLAVPLLIMVSTLSFVLVSLTPGDAADQILGTTATPQEYAALRRALGLNLPLYDQYWQWFHHAITGNLGSSIITGQSVLQALGQRLPVTLSLLLGALLVSVVAGISLGVFSALRGGAVGHTDGLALIGFALPAFWVGAELIVLFAVRLRGSPHGLCAYLSVTGRMAEVTRPASYCFIALWRGLDRKTDS